MTSQLDATSTFSYEMKQQIKIEDIRVLVERKNKILSGFAFRIRNNEFGKTTRIQLSGLYIRTTINYVSTNFKQKGYEDPTLNRPSLPIKFSNLQ